MMLSRKAETLRRVLARSALPVLAGAILLGLGALIWVIASGDDGKPASAAPGGGTQWDLSQWSDVNAKWQHGDLNAQNSAYHEGESVPFMLRVDGAVSGGAYSVTIRYDCDKGGVNAYDFLTRYDRDRGTDPATAAEGPGNTTPDATQTINDDPSMTFDNGETDRVWKLWGGHFGSTNSGPTPSTDCPASSEKTYELAIVADQATVWLLWSGHLSSEADWGPGLGARSISGAPFHMAVDIPGTGVGSRDRSIQPGAILPPMQGTIIVEKQTEPDGAAGSFAFSGDAAGTISDDGQIVVTDLVSGSYTSAESDPTAAGFVLTSITCDDGSSLTPSSGDVATRTATFNLDPGETVKCTFTNAKRPQLIVIKHVVNDDGGTAVAGDFTMTVIGSNPSPASFAGAESPGTTVDLDAGSYSVGESGPAGYAPSYSTDCVGSIAVGEVKTCTVTNDDIPPQLIVIKHVINDDGGMAMASDFTMTVTGDNPVPASFFGAESPGTTVDLDAGSYSVTETGPSGYSASYSADCVGSIAVGQVKTCTITNDDIGSTLKLVKTVINDNGGLLTQADFPSFVDGAAQAWDVATPVMANVQHTASETPHAGYTASVWGGDCAADGTITLLPGDNKTCTITNDDSPPSQAQLTLIKQVINSNGGTKVVADFPLFIDGSPVTSGVANVVTPNVVHTASETQQAGYTASVWGGDCAADGTITLLPGDNKTCTITNDDIGPTLTVIKQVVPSSDSGLFNLQIDGATAGTGANVGNGGTTGEVAVNAGAHTVGETAGTGTNLANYVTAIGGDCAANGAITLALAENKTCTITNTRASTPTPTPTPTPSPTPSPTPTPTPSPTPSPTPTPTPSPTPTSTPQPAPTLTPTTTPVIAPETLTPKPTLTATPTATRPPEVTPATPSSLPPSGGGATSEGAAWPWLALAAAGGLVLMLSAGLVWLAKERSGQ